MIGNFAGAALVIAGFAWLMLRLHLVEHARKVNPIVQQTVATMADHSLDDDAKERAMRGYSAALFRLFAIITGGLLLALGLPMLLVWLVSFTRLWSFDGAIDASLSWPFLLGGLVLFVAVIMLERRRGAN